MTLDFQGDGEGTVTSNPAGVLCDNDCTVSLPRDTAYTLFARPFGTFGGWGGDCSGFDFATPLLLDSDKSCTVVFDP